MIFFVAALPPGSWSGCGAVLPGGSNRPGCVWPDGDATHTPGRPQCICPHVGLSKRWRATRTREWRCWHQSGIDDDDDDDDDDGDDDDGGGDDDWS